MSSTVTVLLLCGRLESRGVASTCEELKYDGKVVIVVFGTGGVFMFRRWHDWEKIFSGRPPTPGPSYSQVVSIKNGRHSGVKRGGE